jgi:hypothetical protein
MGGTNPNIAIAPQAVANPNIALDATQGSGMSPMQFNVNKPWHVPDIPMQEAKKGGGSGTSGSEAGKMAGQLLKMYLASRNGGSPSNFSSMDSFNESFTPTGNYQPPI